LRSGGYESNNTKQMWEKGTSTKEADKGAGLKRVCVFLFHVG